MFDERHVFVETVRRREVCTGCGQRAESGGRHVVQVRDLPVGAKATRLIWHKREWRWTVATRGVNATPTSPRGRC